MSRIYTSCLRIRTFYFYKIINNNCSSSTKGKIWRENVHTPPSHYFISFFYILPALSISLSVSIFLSLCLIYSFSLIYLVLFFINSFLVLMDDGSPSHPSINPSSRGNRILTCCNLRNFFRKKIFLTNP